jgi:hypothetical protein
MGLRSLLGRPETGTGWKSFFGMEGHRTLGNKLRRAREKAIAAGEVGIGANTRVVPQLTIGSQGVAKNGYVQANTGNTANARSRVFEQNFIKRIQSIVFGSLGEEGGVQKGTSLTPELLDSYSRKLDNAASEAEAILYYDELICMIPIIILYAAFKIKFISERNEARSALNNVQNSGVNIHNVMRRELSLREGKEMRQQILNLLVSGTVLAGFITAMVLTGGTVAAPTAAFAISMLSIGAPFAGGAAYGIIIGNPLEKANFRANNNLCYLLLRTCKILFEKREYMFESLIPKLKFWGLKQSQVDILVETNNKTYTNSDIHGFDGLLKESQEYTHTKPPAKTQEFIQAFLLAGQEDTPLAPNDPFPEEVRTVEIQMNALVKPIHNSYRNTKNFGKLMRNTTAPNGSKLANIGQYSGYTYNPNATGGRRNRTRRNRTRSNTRRR